MGPWHPSCKRGIPACAVEIPAPRAGFSPDWSHFGVTIRPLNKAGAYRKRPQALNPRHGRTAKDDLENRHMMTGPYAKPLHYRGIMDSDVFYMVNLSYK